MILSDGMMSSIENYTPKVPQSKYRVKYQTKLSSDYEHKVKRK